MDTPVRSFEFVSYSIEGKKEIILNYALHWQNGAVTQFKEKISLETPVLLESSVQQEAVKNVIRMLHFICGISYWKLYCPSEIVVSTSALTEKEAEFWNTVYTKGLGEFFFKNDIDFQGLVKFPFSKDAVSSPVDLSLEERAIMSIGGGKDSQVTYELLKKIPIETKTFVLETQKEYELISNILNVMNEQAIKVKRSIDPQIFDRKNFPGSYNGHIPITAVYSVVGLLCAVLYNYKYIVLSNEKSSNYGNVRYRGMEINHQWSKSNEFEELFRTYVKQSISPDLNYFSLLRGWTELRIVKEFTSNPRYFPFFSSCNNNFKVYKKSETDRSHLWCGHCPKCAFVFVLLAAFLPKEEVIKIFGKNLLADKNLEDLYKELLGVQNSKPFECVGTPEEVKTAFLKTLEKAEFNEDEVMKMFREKVLPTIQNAAELQNEALKIDTIESIPPRFRAVIL